MNEQIVYYENFCHSINPPHRGGKKKVPFFFLTPFKQKKNFPEEETTGVRQEHEKTPKGLVQKMIIN